MINTISENDLNQATFDKLFEEAQVLFEEAQAWPVLYRKEGVITRQKPTSSTDNGHRFFQRTSTHKVGYDAIRALLYVDHSLNEKKYIETLEDVSALKTLSIEGGGQAGVFWLGFETPRFSANREFVELVATKETDRRFVIVSAPVDYTPVKDKYVRGAYEAWEQVVEKINENGELVIEWTCIQHSSAGGKIPSVMSDWVAGKDFHKDVKSLINYIKDNA
ncbi:Bet v1-like protein [Backusella circina FSU 941]|nr:Bet v1-like protein [Backusella circina FSU 941]